MSNQFKQFNDEEEKIEGNPFAQADGGEQTNKFGLAAPKHNGNFSDQPEIMIRRSSIRYN